MIAVTVVYIMLASSLYMAFLTELPQWALLGYFAIAGLCWFFPAAFVIKWMSRPLPDQ